ncbi:MAG: type II toxin-antitoxin system VapB family antitoxin [Pseudomonadota bacterium]
MPQLNIKNEETYALARELSRITGESMTQAINRAVRERIDRLRHFARTDRQGMAQELLAIGRECSTLPNLDDRHPDEILYDEQGMPKDSSA